MGATRKQMGKVIFKDWPQDELDVFVRLMQKFAVQWIAMLQCRNKQKKERSKSDRQQLNIGI